MSKAFENWFAIQYGVRTFDESVTDQQLKDRVAAGEGAAIELQRRREWDKSRSAAYSAWLVPDHGKEPWGAPERNTSKIKVVRRTV